MGTFLNSFDSGFGGGLLDSNPSNSGSFRTDTHGWRLNPDSPPNHPSRVNERSTLFERWTSGLPAPPPASPPRQSSHSGPAVLLSEAETTTNHRSKVVVVEIGDTGAMRNGDGQTAAHPRIGNSGKTVETRGEAMIRIERYLVEGARAGSAETSCGRAGRRNAEGVLPLLIPGEGDIGLA